MKVANNLPESSRAWVYQSNRVFTAEEMQMVQEKANAFVDSWEAHGTKLNAAVELYYNRFIVFFVDESPQTATGCSIDKSVAFIKSLESALGVQLMDRMNLAYKDKEEIVSTPMAQFQGLVQSGAVDRSTTVFNNMIQTKGEFVSKWEVPASESWHKNLFAV